MSLMRYPMWLWKRVKGSMSTPAGGGIRHGYLAGIMLGHLMFFGGVSTGWTQALEGVPAANKAPSSVVSGGSNWVPDEAYCTVTGDALKYLPPSSRRMAGLLKRIADNSMARDNMFLNEQRAAAYLRESKTAPDVMTQINAMAKVAYETLNAGESTKALGLLDEAENMARTHGRANTKFVADLRVLRAIAHLRLGEQENCITNHNSDSCILPIQKEGIHKVQTGSRKAIELLLEQLSKFPKDRKSAWLLNVASMTVGDYPDKVPAEWLIPPTAFASDYDIKRFPDIAPKLGLDIDDLAGGTITEDFDNDGHLDLLMTDWGLDGPMHYFHNEGNGTFKDRTMEAGLTGLVGGLNAVQGDYNNDGLMDVLILRGAWLGAAGNIPDSLLRNDGNNHFTDVTEEAGLLAFHPNQAGVWFDYNGDGWLDLYFGYESSGDRVHPNKLFRNNRNGTFTECAEESGAAVIGFVKGVTAGDFNNDGRPDLYLSVRGKENVLLRNDGPTGTGTDARWKFTDVGKEAGVTEPISCFPTFFFDYDNDGWEDLFVCGYTMRDVGDITMDYLGLPTNADRPRLFHNKGDGTFADVTKEMGLYRVILGMSANFGDLDNDGYLDMYVGTGDPSLATIIPNRVFRNDAGKKFQDVTTSSGMGHIQKGHGISFADLDNDGDQDIYHSVGGAYQGDYYQNVLFENPGHGNHWITLKLEGVQSNRPGIGARIKIVTQTAVGQQVIRRTVNSGGSFGSNPLRQEIGLGQARGITALEIYWPVTGKTQTITNATMDRFYGIKEGAAEAVELPWKATPFLKQHFESRPYQRHQHRAGG